MGFMDFPLAKTVEAYQAQVEWVKKLISHSVELGYSETVQDYLKYMKESWEEQLEKLKKNDSQSKDSESK